MQLMDLAFDKGASEGDDGEVKSDMLTTGNIHGIAKWTRRLWMFSGSFYAGNPKL